MDKIALFLVIFIGAMVAQINGDLPPQTPIIGIYTQSIEQDSGNSQYSYIAASYVKYIEMSGAQVVPIYAYSNQSYIDSILSQINGVLFPGGGQQFNIDNKWTSNARRIFDYAIDQNDKHNPFPIWGTCLGLQLLAYLSANNDVSVITPVRGESGVINTIKVVDPASKIFANLPYNVMQQATKGNGILYFNHRYALSLSTFQNTLPLVNFWDVSSTTTSSYNEVFVSAMSAQNYPFFAVQFHPEKNLFQWKVNADRSSEGVEIVQILSNNFIEEARKSKNTFQSPQQFYNKSIYNFQPYQTNSSFTLVYLFQQSIPSMSLRIN